ncbi:MAG: hypothetical protein EB078_04825 [Proteobacteria bacterium]|nr:hypothetical protein [Pseudomonadota bacterium]
MVLLYLRCVPVARASALPDERLGVGEGDELGDSGRVGDEDPSLAVRVAAAEGGELPVEPRGDEVGVGGSDRVVLHGPFIPQAETACTRSPSRERIRSTSTRTPRMLPCRVTVPSEWWVHTGT